MSKSQVANSLLVAFHAVAGVVTATISADEPAASSAIFLSLVFCQTSLVGVWAGFGHAHLMLRLVGMMLGVVLLTLVLGLGAKSDPKSLLFLLVFVATSVVALVTWTVRLSKARLAQSGEETANLHEGLQFTIRHLLLLTFLVACLVTTGKWLAPQLEGLRMVVQIIVLGLCFVAVALASIWATLGSGRIAFRMIPVLFVAGASGWVGAFAIHGSEFRFWISVTVLEALFLIASLAVLRGCGYRLVAFR